MKITPEYAQHLTRLMDKALVRMDTGRIAAGKKTLTALRMELVYQERLETNKLVVHGKTCKKVEHSNRRVYLHNEDDDGPYDVDGLTYCGRCHYHIPDKR